jgi:hypothetical protein
MQIRRQENRDMESAGIERICNKLFDSLIGARIEAFRKQLDDSVAEPNVDVVFFFT